MSNDEINSSRDCEMMPFGTSFLVIEEHGTFSVMQRVSFTGKHKSINIHYDHDEFSSIDDLFFALLYQRHPCFCFTDECINQINLEISDVYFNSSLYKEKLTPQQRHSLYRYFENNRPEKLIYKQSPSFDLFDATSKADLSSPNTYFEALESARKLNFQPREIYSLIFQNGEDLIYWAFRKVIDTNREIGFCPTCKKYFLEQTTKQKYCSKACYRNRKKEGSFCGDTTIQNNYQAIDKVFRRKFKSKSYYSYNSNSFTDNFNELLLFSRFHNPEKHDTPTAAIFSSDDYKTIKKAYEKEFNARYSVFRDCYRRHCTNLLSDLRFSDEQQALYSWQNNVRLLLDSFERDH